MSCDYADDAFLISRFPGVVTAIPGSWQVSVGAPVVAGDYGVEVDAATYSATVGAAEPVSQVRDKIKVALAAQNPLVLAVSSTGTDSLLLRELSSGLVSTVLPVFPAGGALTVTQITPQDNAVYRATWLESTKCMVDCRWFRGCCAEFTLAHAAYTAFFLALFEGTDGTGLDASAYSRLRLGPGEVQRYLSAGSAPPEFLQRNNYGELALMLTRRRVPGLLVSGGPSARYPTAGGRW